MFFNQDRVSKDFPIKNKLKYTSYILRQCLNKNILYSKTMFK